VYEIPKPELLNPDRVDRDDREHFTAEDHRSRAQLLATALAESCAYADQLWDQVNALRGYLLESLPPDPRSPGAHPTAPASPTGPDDEDGWRNWIHAFATTTSVLCGSHGDSGFGLSRAREEARLRRTAPALTQPSRDPGPDNEAAAPSPAASPPRTPATPDVQSGSQARRSPSPIAKATAATVIAILALRGLRHSGAGRVRPAA
jgi:hypothetical protein